MPKKAISVKTVVAVGVGAALVFVLMRFVSIPSGIPNVNINLGLAALSMFAAIFGPVAGLLIGFIAHTLTDLTFGWGVWWSWVISSALYGLAVGCLYRLYRVEEGTFGVKQAVMFNVVQIAANAVVWMGIAPTLDILIYQEPADKVFAQGLAAGLSNIVTVLVLGTALVIGYAKTRTRAGSLKAE
jgi:energy-coupling factor transport system substrate-specific component